VLREIQEADKKEDIARAVVFIDQGSKYAK